MKKITESLFIIHPGAKQEFTSVLVRSPAVIHYWITDDINKNPPTLEYEDVADYDLRELIKQVIIRHKIIIYSIIVH